MASSKEPQDPRRVLYAEKRKQRRHNLPPRLTVASDADGTTLTVPLPPSARRWRLIVWVSALGWIVPLALGPMAHLTVLGVGCMLWGYLWVYTQDLRRAEPLTRIRVDRRGQFTITRWGRSRPLSTGQTADVEVRIDYDDDTALPRFEWAPAQEVSTSFRRLGKGDLAILKDFCSSNQVTWTIVGISDKADAANFGDSNNKALIVISVVFAVLLGLLWWQS